MPGRCPRGAHARPCCAPVRQGANPCDRVHVGDDSAATPLLDTLRLAKAVVPGLGSYGLDSLLGHYGIPRPAGRHRAMPDVEVTVQVLTRLLNDGCAGGRWSTVLELDMTVRLQPTRPPAAPDAEQGALF
ncbi:exonuclease domain-containing protein [Streptomyces sp. NPDC092903]|uniref:3'-5' exonuclease n=1 Tax=Streptomyces sp. NPDC092903 TaxID=3366017 RepID=UPI0037F7E184